MGDVCQNINNATIVNKSKVRNAFDKVESEYDKETSKALVEIAEFIENSKNSSAAQSFDNFTDELAKPQPDKSKLRSFWSSIQNALPDITAIAGSVARIVQLFT